jgi:ABC-type phosphate transport system substrate-binding protein
MFTNGQPKGATAEYIKFLLSPEGQKIVKKEGFVPLK